MHAHLSVSYAGFARAFDTRALCYRTLLVDFQQQMHTHLSDLQMHTHLSVSYAGFARAFDTRALCYRALLVDFNNKCTHICL